MAERCGWCGRFMKHHWFQSSDEPDSWQDYWTCRPECEARSVALEAAFFASHHPSELESGS